ncbi:MAG TPA: prepilin-type cleavage/methylation domain-containing protein [Planctomycetaceae bacterium]|nr:prepilin-type cleavage/methylation domain-containing protein [Planctomycetaceae bacterium]
MLFRREGFGREHEGFTLVELLVVIAIIGVLVALLLPAVQAAREAARRIQCSNRIKQVALAMHAYEDANKVLPYASEYVTSSPTPKGTATAFVLPYLEQQAVYDMFHFEYMFSYTINRPAVTTPIPQITCPSDPQSVEPILSGRYPDAGNPSRCHGMWYAPSGGPVHDRYKGVRPCVYCEAVTSYAHWSTGNFVYCCQGFYFGSGMFGSEMGIFPGMFGRCPIGVKFAEVTDGLSNTIMLGETIPGHSIWNGAYLQNLPIYMTHIPLNNMMTDNGSDTNGPAGTAWWQHTMGFKSYHPGGANFAMGDGSVQFLNDTIDYQLYNALGTMAGGEVFQESLH